MIRIWPGGMRGAGSWRVQVCIAALSVLFCLVPLFHGADDFFQIADVASVLHTDDLTNCTNASTNCKNASALVALRALRDERDCSSPFGIARVHPDGACAEGSVVLNGFYCTPQCKNGWCPTDNVLFCYDGVFTPTNFQCEPCSCPAPVIVGINGSGCKEGPEISHGGTCTPNCGDGYRLDADQWNKMFREWKLWKKTSTTTTKTRTTTTTTKKHGRFRQ